MYLLLCKLFSTMNHKYFLLGLAFLDARYCGHFEMLSADADFILLVRRSVFLVHSSIKGQRLLLMRKIVHLRTLHFFFVFKQKDTR